MRERKYNYAGVIFALLTAFVAGTTTARAAETAAIQGTSYACYMYVPFGIINTTIEFEFDGGLVIEEWDGNGFYISTGNIFVGFYWAVDAFTPKDGKEGDSADQDVMILLSGFGAGAFVGGTGLIILDYGELYITGLVGIKTRQEEEEEEG